MTLKTEGFERIDALDTSTLMCKCGSSLTWAGPDVERLGPWIEQHRPHLVLPPDIGKRIVSGVTAMVSRNLLAQEAVMGLQAEANKPGFHGKGRIDWSAMTPDEEAMVLAILELVGRGITATWTEEWGHFKGGSFVLSNGVRIEVFNDAGDWDYIDSIEMPDGRRWEYPCDTDFPLPMSIAQWVPKKANAKAWGVPASVCR